MMFKNEQYGEAFLLEMILTEVTLMVDGFEGSIKGDRVFT